MAIEIEEIAVRLRVGDDAEKPPDGQLRELQRGCCEDDREGVIEECVRRVLRLLDVTAAR
jgi:hypothetical protein